MAYFDSCPPERRFGIPTALCWPGGPRVFTIVDADQRCCIELSVADEDAEDDFAMDTIARHIDQLDPDVTLIDVSTDGALISTSRDPQHGDVEAIMFTPLEKMPAEFTSSTICRPKLVEVERLANTCDLVSYVDATSGVRREAVFKYEWYGRWAGKQWDELNCWIRLTGHPNIIPFDRIVTDHAELPGLGHKEVVVGFTTKFVGGGTLDDKRGRPFKFKYLEQLFLVIDDLNLKHGIAHQDLAARNIFIEPSTDTLQISDFNWSARIGHESPLPPHPGHYMGAVYESFRDDVKGVAFTLYEIITGDSQHLLTHDSKISDVLAKDWIQHPHVTLDRDLQDYREALQKWAAWRNQPENIIEHYKDAPEHIDWPIPFIPVLPEKDAYGTILGMRPYVTASRSCWKSFGVDIIEWKRPAHNRVPDVFYVLGNGELALKSEIDANYS
ncbi:hypothetical protein Daus18300_008434 [Diaporthe australafricana]|uniref:Protein kinase domain-containing protein n=1 Tax=Diaporthe australafricana TaxID=127596 RepID=A0ABR3WII9_9PEZI